MEVNYIDLGTHRGDEIEMFLNIVNSYEIKNVNIYGFEAHKELFLMLKNRYKTISRFKAINAIISDKKGLTKLYIASSNAMEGNSIFKSKNNVSEDDYVEAESVVMSEWIKENIPNYKDCVNIIRFNIEGAEIHLMNDLINSGMHKHIDLFLGAKGGVDILKCSEIAHLHKDYNDNLKKNSIEVHQFCKASIDNVSDSFIANSILKLIR